MKGLLAVLIAAVVALNVYNWWEIRSLRQELASVRANVQKVEAESKSHDLMAQARQAVDAARIALSGVDTSSALASLETARKRLSDAATYASEKSAPALKWLEQQVHDLSRKAQEASRK